MVNSQFLWMINKHILRLMDNMSPSNIRERYINGDLFSVGDIVLHKKTRTIHEVVSLGSNYLTIVDSSGSISKSWLGDVIDAASLREDFDDLRKKRASRNQVSFAGYKTRNFTQEISEQFKPLIKEHRADKFQVLSLIRVTDELLSEIATLSAENYNKVKTLLERNEKYLKRFDKLTAHSAYRTAMVDQLSMYELDEDLRVSSLDQQRAAQIICDALGCQSTGTPEEMVSAAAASMKSRRFTPEAWKIAGKMFNMATDVGIKWNKGIFADPTRRAMEIK